MIIFLYAYIFYYFILGIILNIHIHKMINILKAENISIYTLEFNFSFKKFKKFIETCNDDELKFKYTKLYNKARLLRKMLILSFIFFIILLFCSAL